VSYFLLPCLLSLLSHLITGSEAEVQNVAVELDHFFVAVPTPDSGVEALREAGFVEGPSAVHRGQGTASRGFVFENAYLELIWLSDGEEARSPAVRRTRLEERTRAGSHACPFGIGLRNAEGTQARVPFATWEYKPPYLPEGYAIRMAETSEDLQEPLVFFLPWVSAPVLEAPRHPNGARRVTGLHLGLESEEPKSSVLAALQENGVASFTPDGAFLMDLELDGGAAGQSLDLRPLAPLRIRW
jgi:hypothetical protein